MPGVVGRVALVTGASQGIGRACALALAEGGALIALAARNEESWPPWPKRLKARAARRDVSHGRE